jgi:hypothetical protein
MESNNNNTNVMFDKLDARVTALEAQNMLQKGLLFVI